MWYDLYVFWLSYRNKYCTMYDLKSQTFFCIKKKILSERVTFLNATPEHQSFGRVHFLYGKFTSYYMIRQNRMLYDGMTHRHLPYHRYYHSHKIITSCWGVMFVLIWCIYVVYGRTHYRYIIRLLYAQFITVVLHIARFMLLLELHGVNDLSISHCSYLFLRRNISWYYHTTIGIFIEMIEFRIHKFKLTFPLNHFSLAMEQKYEQTSL